jgi:hypothetical protein
MKSHTRLKEAALSDRQLNCYEKRTLAKLIGKLKKMFRFDQGEKEWFVSWDDLSLALSNAEYKSMCSALNKFSEAINV